MISISKIGDLLRVTFAEFSENNNGKQIITLEKKFSEELYRQIQELKSFINNPSESDRKNYKEFYTSKVEEIKRLMEEDFDAVLSSITQELVQLKDGNVYLKHKGEIAMVPMPKEFVEWIQDRIDNGETIEPIIKFWIRLLRNPNIRDTEDATAFAKEVCLYVIQTTTDTSLYKTYVNKGYSDEVAKSMATVQQTPITDEGLIHTMKVVDVDVTTWQYYDKDDKGQQVLKIRDDVKVDAEGGDLSDPEKAEDWVFCPAIHKNGDKFYCGSEPNKYIYKVGHRAMLPSWDMVTKRKGAKHIGAGPGFYVGNLDWIRSYEHRGNATLNCFVCPSKIGTVIHWMVEDGGLIVKEFFPHSIKDREFTNKEFYTSSAYGSMLDEEWIKEKEEIMKRFDTEKEEYLEELEKRKSTVI